MNQAILIQADDEGHTLNEGKSRIKYFVELSKKYNFDLKNMKEKYLSNEDNRLTEDIGNFPEDIDGFINNYKD